MYLSLSTIIYNSNIFSHYITREKNCQSFYLKKRKNHNHLKLNLANSRYQRKRHTRLAKRQPKPFDVILVWKYSRFARNREDSVVYKSMLRKEKMSVSEYLKIK